MSSNCWHDQPDLEEAKLLLRRFIGGHSWWTTATTTSDGNQFIQCRHCNQIVSLFTGEENDFHKPDCLVKQIIEFLEASNV